MLKTTSLASVISMEELMRNAQMLAQIEFRVLEVYIVAAIWYLILVSIWGLIQVRIEAYYEKPFGPAAAVSPDAKRNSGRPRSRPATSEATCTDPAPNPDRGTT